MSNRPDLRDYGPDLTGASSSADAMEAFIADCNAEKCSGVLPKGQIVIDRYCGAFIGSAAVGEQTGPNVYENIGGLQGRNTTVIVIPKWAGMPAGVGSDAPPFSFANGSGLYNVTFVQPDLAASITNIEVEDMDGEGEDEHELRTANYALGGAVTGAPDRYAPCIKSEHLRNSSGSLRTTSINSGRCRFENIELGGCYAGFYIRDDTLDGLEELPTVIGGGGEETIHDQAGVAGLEIRGVRGFCLHETFLLGGVSGLARISDCQLGQAFWQPTAGNAPDQRLVMWARRNADVFHLVNRCVGLTIENVGARVARNFLHFSGGGGADYDGPYKGNPGGKVNGLTVHNSGGEQVTRGLLIDADSYSHRNNIQLLGSFIDSADPTCTDAVIEILTDRDLAGSLSHAIDEDPESETFGERIFKPMAGVPGFNFAVDLYMQKSSGPVIRSNPKDGHARIKLSGSAGGVSRGDPSLPMYIVPDGSRLKITASAMQHIGTRSSSTTLFDSAPGKVRMIGCEPIGVGELFAGQSPSLDDRNWAGTAMSQEIVSPDLDDDDPVVEVA